MASEFLIPAEVGEVMAAVARTHAIPERLIIAGDNFGFQLYDSLQTAVEQMSHERDQTRQRMVFGRRATPEEVSRYFGAKDRLCQAASSVVENGKTPLDLHHRGII